MLQMGTSLSLNLMMSAFCNVQTPFLVLLLLRVASKSGCSWVQPISGTPMAGAFPLSHKAQQQKHDDAMCL